MAKAFEAPGEPIPTIRQTREVYEVDNDAFTGVLHNDDDRLIKIQWENIVESERPRVVRGIFFFCDLELAPDGDIKGIRGIEFSDELTADEQEKSISLLAQTMASARERIIPEE